MPYIIPERRPEFDPLVDSIICQLGRMGFQTGDLNYVLTRVAKGFLHDMTDGKPGYTARSQVGGVLQDVRDEWVRRLLNAYEDGKIRDNGDLPLEQGCVVRTVEQIITPKGVPVVIDGTHAEPDEGGADQDPQAEQIDAHMRAIGKAALESET